MAKKEESLLTENGKMMPPSVTTPLPRQKLNKDLQKLADTDDLFDDIYEGEGPDTTETAVRYAAYTNRIRTIMLSASRYVAYTSDVGESFRPVAHPYLVKGAYGISWAYLIGDVSHEGYKAYCRNQKLLYPPVDESLKTSSLEVPAAKSQKAEAKVHIPAIEDYRAVMAQRAVFQSIASMGLPAFTIHSIVRYSGQALKNSANVRLRTWGPIGLGLAAVPALPYMFDEPVEQAVDYIFYQGFKAVGGEGAVGPRHHHGKHAQKEKLKEL